MGQAEVIQFLKENPRQWFTTKEIAKSTGLEWGTIICNCMRLRKAKMVNIDYDTDDFGRPNKAKGYKYKHKK